MIRPAHFSFRGLSCLSEGARVLVALLCLGHVVHAQQFAISLSAPDDDACVSAEGLTQRVEERAGIAAQSGVAAQLNVSVEIARSASGHRARVTVYDAARARGEREIEAEGECSALDDVLTLVIASSVGVSQATPVQPVAIALEPPTRDTPRTRDNPLTLESPEPALPWSSGADVSMRLQSGLVPEALGAASIGLSLERGALRFGVSGTLFTSSGIEGQTLHANGGWGELSACVRMAESWRTSFAFCTGVQAGAVRARAYALTGGRARWDGLVQLAPSVQMRVAVLPWLGPSLSLGAALPVLFPRYSYLDRRGAQLFYEAVKPGIWGQIGLWIRFES